MKNNARKNVPSILGKALSAYLAKMLAEQRAKAALAKALNA